MYIIVGFIGKYLYIYIQCKYTVEYYTLYYYTTILYTYLSIYTIVRAILMPVKRKISGIFPDSTKWEKFLSLKPDHHPGTSPPINIPLGNHTSAKYLAITFTISVYPFTRSLFSSANALTFCAVKILREKF